MILFKKTVILLVFVPAVLSYDWKGWPASNYSKSAATYGEGALDDMVDWSQHPCKRECKDHEEPMLCRYGFTVEHYVIMSKACYNCPFNATDCYRPHCIPGDGHLKSVLAVNRRLPGPTIEVCKNDRIIVDVKNKLSGESTTMHWHGMHQHGTPFMDGVPMVTQCPIAAGDSFRYEFVAENPGTHWWHAHNAFQRSEGLFGGLVVRSSPSQNLLGRYYDLDEHLLILNEWNDRSIIDTYSLLYNRVFGIINVRSIFINGWGRDTKNANSSLIPHPVFHVKKGSRYRFRLVNAGSFVCSMNFSVDQHSLLAISTDGGDFEPLEVDVIRSIAGETYDFVLDANREVDNYWIRVTSTENCATAGVQKAIIRYEGAPDVEPIEPNNLQPGKRLLNPPGRGSETDGALCISCSLTSLEPDDQTLTQSADHQLYIILDVYNIYNPDFYRKDLYDVGQGNQYPSYTVQMNHLSFKAPEFPLQTQPELIGPNQLCNVTETKCTREQCSCPYVVQFKLNSIVEIVFVNEARHRDWPDNSTDIEIAHPMHFHGFYNRVLAMEKLGRVTSVAEVQALDQAGKIHRKLKGAPYKDVIDVPSGGYAIVRFRADNPGFWFFHCHLETHMHNGMAMVAKVGEYEDFPSVPDNFPKCHYNN